MQLSKNISDAGFLLAVNLIVNVGNYGLNIVLGRWLGPAGFADANMLATIVMVLSFVAMGLQLVVAKYAAEFTALDQKENLDSFLFTSKSVVKKTSVGLVLVLLILSPILNGYLNFHASLPLIILIVGIPSYFLMSVSRGLYQGASQFRTLAKTYLREMLVRLTVTLGFLFLIGNENYSAEIIALGFLISFVITHLKSSLKIESQVTLQRDKVNQMIRLFLMISAYELSQILINNSDVILVKHHFENTEAGLYASLALLGRAVFFATWIIVTMLFPKVIEREKKGEPHQDLFWKALSIVALMGASMTIICYCFDNLIVNLAFGAAYLEISNLLWMYALSTTLFACANVVVYYNMSLERFAPIWVSVAAGALQVFLINHFHQSLEIVIQVQMILMAVLLGTLISYQKLRTFPLFKKTNQIIKI